MKTRNRPGRKRSLLPGSTGAVSPQINLMGQHSGTDQMPKTPRKNNRVSRRDFLTCLGTAPIAAALLGRPANAGAKERDDGKEREVRGDKDKKKLLACLGGEWTLPIGDLGKGHGEKLIPAREATHFIVAVVASNTPPKLFGGGSIPSIGRRRLCQYACPQFGRQNPRRSRPKSAVRLKSLTPCFRCSSLGSKVFQPTRPSLTG